MSVRLRSIRRALRRGCAAAAGLSAVVWAAGCSAPAPPARATAPQVTCSAAVTAGRPLAGIRPVTLRVPGKPADVVATPDGRWEFASMTAASGGEVAVLSVGHGPSRLVRTVAMPDLMKAGFGMALTHDGRPLLVAGYTGTAVLSVPALENGTGHAAAGCGPARVAVSPDGGTAWVTAQTSNALLAFSTADLRRQPAHALRAVVRVGSEPAGLPLADGGKVALVTNSNRGLVPGTASDAPQTVSVVRTAAALAHRPALAGAVPAGLFPRDLALDPATGDVLLANYGSGTVEEFPVPKT